MLTVIDKLTFIKKKIAEVESVSAKCIIHFILTRVQNYHTVVFALNQQNKTNFSNVLMTIAVRQIIK